MAKISGPIASAMRGKVGQVVAAKTVGGDTALRAYQPVVKNPNTLRQQSARFRFKTVSAFAAKFAEIISIGFAAVASGAKMYPRNMFVKAYAPYGVDGINIADGEVEYNFSALKFSRKLGVEVAPTGTYDSSAHKVNFTNTADVPLKTGQVLGVVTLFVTNDGEFSGVVKSVATQGAAVPASLLALGLPLVAYSFYKVIEPSATEVETETWPWKYPSPTGPQNGGVTVTNQ